MKEEILKAIKKAYPNLEVSISDIELEHPTVEEHGDYSTNIALKLGLDAKKIAAQIPSATVAGRGFINFTLSPEFLIQELKKTDKTYGSSKLGDGKTVVIDYSAPNIAKRFGIGHLRSTIIGQAIYNILKFQGYQVVGDNHLGDWGTQFGKLLYMIDTYNPKSLTIDELEKLYVQFHKDPTPEMEDKAREWFKKLEDGDIQARQIWQKCVEISLKEFDRVYALLNVKIDFTYGESFYEDKMPEVIADCQKISKKSDGAIVIEIPNIKTPLMLVKSDGGTTYATRDLATLKFRQKTWDPDIVIYEVGAEQSLHFVQVFAVARMLGYVKKSTQLIHTKHGLYRLSSGKFSTRKGNTPKLEEILDEAISRAAKLGSKETAREVGIGAIKYFDLKHSITGDIIFDWENMFALQGDSGPYLQYTYARAKSVLRKSCHSGQSPESSRTKGMLEAPSMTPEEIAVLRWIYRFPEVVEQAGVNYSPNVICTYLFELAKRFNNFYNNVPILPPGHPGGSVATDRIFQKDSIASLQNDGNTNSRLLITASVAQILENGLGLLGIEALEKM